MTDSRPPDVEPMPAPPAASPPYAPWYTSAIVKSLITILCTVAMKGVALWLKQHNIDLDLSVIGLTPDTLADYVIVTVIPAAAGYALHGRTSKPLPKLTLTRANADAANANFPTPQK